MSRPQVKDYISGKLVDAKPEEVFAVQPYLKILVEDYNYPKKMIQAHPQVYVKASPSDKKGYPVDIAVFEDDSQGNKDIKMVVECKAPNKKEGIGQLEDYLKFCNAQFGIWYNGSDSAYVHKIERSGNITFEEIPAIPQYHQKYSEIGLYKRKDLKPTHNLKEVFAQLRGYIAGNSREITRDDEIAKQLIHLILCKIYDERFTAPEDMVTFRASEDDTDEEIKERIDNLFDSVRAKYNDVLSESDGIVFDGHTLRFIISKLHQFCISETSRDTIGDAFEVFMGDSLKGSQGQFFTPKNVVKLLINVVDPELGKVIIDPSCGSGGFLVEALNYLWKKNDLKAKKYHWSEPVIAEERTAIGIKNIRGIEKDSFLSKVSKSYMAVLGDGRGGIFCEDSLD